MSGEETLHNTAKPPATSNVAGLLTVFLMVVFGVGLFVLYFFKSPVDPEIRTAHVQILGMQSTHAQIKLYLGLIGLLTIICVTALIRPQARLFSDAVPGIRVLPLIVFILAIILGAGSAPKGFSIGFLLVAAFIFFRTKGWLRHKTGTWRSLSVSSLQRSGNWQFWLMTGVLVIFLGAFLFLPLSTPLIIHGAAEFIAKETHYAVTVLPGFDFICCSDVGTIERANYGLGMPLLSAFALKALSLAGIADPTLVQVVKLYQIVAAVLICILSFFLNRRASPYVAVLALGMTAYSLTNISDAVGAPNQSGIRYIIFLTALLVLVLETRKARPRIWLLASAAAIFFLLSPEAGLATTAGYLVAMVLKGYSPASPIASITRVVMYFGVSFVAMIIAGFMMIAGLITNISTGGLLEFVSLFAGGYGGLAAMPSTTAILLFFFAVGAVLRGVWRARRGKLVWVDLYQASVGTIMLVWFMYYMNRMHNWNLWFQLVMLAFMIAPRLTPGSMRLLFWLPSRRVITYPVIIACFIGGQFGHSAYKLSSYTAEWSRTDFTDCVLINGMCLKGALGSQTAEKLETLAARFSPRDTLVLSKISSSVRLKGFNEGFPWYEPFGEVIRNRDVDLFVDWIERRGPKYILVDDPNSLIAQAWVHHNYDDVITRLDSYRKTGTDTGWVIYERIDDATAGRRIKVPSKDPVGSDWGKDQEISAHQFNGLPVKTENS